MRQRILAYFYATHAVSAAEAVPYKPQGQGDAAAFQRLQRLGVIREASRGTYWVDVPAQERAEHRRRMILVPVIIALSVALAVGLTLFYRG